MGINSNKENNNEDILLTVACHNGYESKVK